MSSLNPRRSTSHAAPGEMVRDDDHARSRSSSPRDNHPRNGTRSRSRTRSRSPSRDRSRSRSRDSRAYRDRTRTRSLSRARSPSIPRSAKIVIEKLTKNINATHLREIFSTYGEIDELEMPMNPQFMMNKGIAYILYEKASYAESAIAHMHEAQVDGALINVSIVLPRRRFSRSPPMKRPPPNRFGEPGRMRDGPGGRGPPPDRAYGGRGPPPRASPGYRGRGGRGSPPPRHGGGGRGGGHRDDRNVYRPAPGGSPPRRSRRSPSYDSRSRSGSRSPPPRRRDHSPARGGGRRRSPSYSSYGSRSRSPSRDRGGRRR